MSHWRNSMKPTRFFFMDARAALFFLVLMMHFRLWTFLAVLTITVIFWMAERFGLTYGAALRAVRLYIIGPNRPSLIWTSKRRMIDYG